MEGDKLSGRESRVISKDKFLSCGVQALGRRYALKKWS